MGEEQGLSAENRATLSRLHLLILNWTGEPISPHAEIGRLTYQMLGQIMDAARSEGLQPPVGEVERVFSSLGASKAPSSASAGVAETPSGGWINWGGGPNPVPGAEVFWRNASGETGMCPADELWGWSAPGHSNRVVAYCVIGQTPGGEA